MHKSPPRNPHPQQQQQDNHHHHLHHSASSSSAVHQNHESSSACGGGGSSGDMLLQWGQNKRSRCSRTEGRSMVSVVLEKHHSSNNNHIMPPPHPHPLPLQNPNPSSLPSTSGNNGTRTGVSTRVRPHGSCTPSSTKNRYSTFLLTFKFEFKVKKIMGFFFVHFFSSRSKEIVLLEEMMI